MGAGAGAVVVIWCGQCVDIGAVGVDMDRAVAAHYRRRRVGQRAKAARRVELVVGIGLRRAARQAARDRARGQVRSGHARVQRVFVHRHVRIRRCHQRAVGQVDRQRRGRQVAVAVPQAVDEGVAGRPADRVRVGLVGVGAVCRHRQCAQRGRYRHRAIGHRRRGVRSRRAHAHNRSTVRTRRVVGQYARARRHAQQRAFVHVGAVGHRRGHVVIDRNHKTSAGRIPITVRNNHAEVVGFDPSAVRGRAGQRVDPAVVAVGIGYDQGAVRSCDRAAEGYIYAAHNEAGQGVTACVDRESAAAGNAAAQVAAVKATLVHRTNSALSSDDIHSRNRVDIGIDGPLWHQAFKVTTGGRHDRDGRQGCALETFGGNGRSTGKRIVCNGDDCAVGQCDGDFALRCIEQRGCVGYGCAFGHNVRSAQGHRGDIPVIHHGGRGAGPHNGQVLKIAVGRRAHAVDGSGDGGCALDVIFVGAGVNGDIGEQAAGGNRHGLLHAANGHVQDQIRLRRLVNAEAEGYLVAFNDVVHVAIHHADTHRDGCGVDGVVDNRDNCGVIYRDAVKAAALHRIYGGLEGFAVFVDVIALHGHQHRAGAGPGRYDDDRAVAQGDGHIGRGRFTQGDGVGNAGTAFKYNRVRGEHQRGAGEKVWVGLQIRQQVRRGVGVFVCQRFNTFHNAQQLHKADAAVSTGAPAQTGRRGFQLGAQVAAALKGLDDGLCRGTGGGNRAVLGGGALVGFGDVFVKSQHLAWRHRQQAAVVHEEFDLDIARGADGFAFLQDVSGLELAADALRVDGKSGAGAGDGGNCGNLDHDVLQLRHWV